MSVFVLTTVSVASSSGGELESDLGREALREICCSSLSRILDLPDNKLEILLGEEDEDEEQGNSATNNVAKNIAHKLKALSHRLRFDDHHSSSKNAMETTGATSFPTLQFGTSIDVPGQDVLVKLMTHIETFCDEEGIFRKSGSHSRIEQMISDLGSLPFESVASNPLYSPPDFSSVLKHYFKELPEPLLLRKHLEAYRQASDMDEEKRMLCLQLLMLLLPPTHHIVLTHLLHLLSIVSAHSETSLMTPHNLAVVFGPTLFLHKTLDDVMGEVLPKVTSLLEYMIIHNVEIFEIPVEVRLVAEKYMKRREISEDTSAIPVDIYSSACKKTCSTSEFHEQGRDNAVAELSSLYEFVKKMPDGPQKQMFLKKFETGSKMAGTPPPYVKSKKTKENKATPKLPKAVGSHQINTTVTPMRPVFKKGFQLLGTEGGVAGEIPPVPSYATPLRPTANLVQYERMETDV